jgi:hypothetical protein
MTQVIRMEVPGSKEEMLKALRRVTKVVKSLDEPNNGLYVVLMNDRDQPILLESINLHPLQIIGACSVIGLQQTLELLPEGLEEMDG